MSDYIMKTCQGCGLTGLTDAHSPSDLCKDCEHDAEREYENCDHDWRFSEHAYEGDPNVPNGTRDYRVFVCEKCGEEEYRA
jgi:predicted nucleic-acid-binding Zn-ribbon protein